MFSFSKSSQSIGAAKKMNMIIVTCVECQNTGKYLRSGGTLISEARGKVIP